MSLSAVTLRTVTPTGRTAQPGAIQRFTLVAALEDFLSAGHGLAGDVVKADDLLHSLLHPDAPRTPARRAERATEIIRRMKEGK